MITRRRSQQNVSCELHLAAMHKDTKLARKLVTSGDVNINDVDAEGKTALHYAVEVGCFKMVDLLIAEGASVNCLAKDKNTPLHLAILNHNEDLRLLNLLLTSGSKVDAKNSKGETALHLCSYFGKNKTAKALIKAKAMVDAQNIAGETALHISVPYGNKILAELLLKNGASINAQNGNGESVLHYCCRGLFTQDQNSVLYTQNCWERTPKAFSSGSLYDEKTSMAVFLLNNGASVNISDKKGDSLLHYCSHYHCNHVAAVLLKEKPKINDVNRKGETPLHIAIWKKNSSLANLLLDNGAEVNIFNLKNDTPLHYCSRFSQNEVAAVLLEKRAVLDPSNSKGETPLHIAIEKKNTSLALLLLDKGAVVDVCDLNRETPIHYCSHFGENKVAAILLQKKATLNLANLKGETALHIAVKNQNASLVELLLDNQSIANVPLLNTLYSADQVHLPNMVILREELVNAQNHSLEAPLHLALKNTSNKRQAIIEMLLGSGAVVNIQNSFKETPLHVSLAKKDWESASLLLRNRANLSIPDSKGNTALHYAAIHSADLYFVQFELIGRGAIVGKKNANGNSPLHFCAEKHNLELAELLVENGAKIDARNYNGETPLHLALWRNNKKKFGDKYICPFKGHFLDPMEDMVTKLICLGASINIKDKKNRTCFDVALSFDSHHPAHPHVLGILSTHVKSLRQAGLPIDEQLVCLSNLYPMCNRIPGFSTSRLREQELIKTKIVKTFEGSQLGIVFSQAHNPRYLNNEELFESLGMVLKSPVLKREFPAYWHILRNTFKKTKHELDILQQAPQSLGDLFAASTASTPEEEHLWQLPSVVKRHILSYLSKADLENLVDWDSEDLYF